MTELTRRERELLTELADLRKRVARLETKEYGSGSGTVDAFLELTDTPDAYTGSANTFVRVNSGTTALTFGTVDWTDVYSKPSTFTPSGHGASHHFGSADPVGTATPTANAIPYADGSGWLDAWISNTAIPRYTGTATAGAITYWTGAGTVAPASFGTADVAFLAAANTWTQAQTIASTTVNSHALGVTRNLDATNTTSAVAIFIQDHASDDQAVLALRQDGTGAVAEFYDGATLVLRSNDGGRLDVHNIIRALSASGIRIEDDGGNLGIGVADGGRVGIGTDTPAGTEADSIFTVEHSSVSAMYMSMINTGTGQVGFVLRRTGGTASRWIHYVDGGTERYAIYNGTYNGNVAAFTETGRSGFGTDSPQGKVHIDQASTTAAIPPLILDQADLSEEMIEFTTTVGAGNPIDTAALGAYYGKVRVNVTGVGYKYIALYD